MVLVIAKASAVSYFLHTVFQMELDIASHTGLNVARVNKVHTGSLPLRQPAKSVLGRKIFQRQLLKLAERNVRTLLDRHGSKRLNIRQHLLLENLPSITLTLLHFQTRLPHQGSIIEASIPSSGVADRKMRGEKLGWGLQ